MIEVLLTFLLAVFSIGGGDLQASSSIKSSQPTRTITTVDGWRIVKPTSHYKITSQVEQVSSKYIASNHNNHRRMRPRLKRRPATSYNRHRMAKRRDSNAIGTIRMKRSRFCRTSICKQTDWM